MDSEWEEKLGEKDIPDLAFYHVKVSKSVDRRFWRTWKSSDDTFLWVDNCKHFRRVSSKLTSSNADGPLIIWLCLLSRAARPTRSQCWRDKLNAVQNVDRRILNLRLWKGRSGEAPTNFAAALNISSTYYATTYHQPLSLYLGMQGLKQFQLIRRVNCI